MLAQGGERGKLVLRMDLDAAQVARVLAAALGEVLDRRLGQQVHILGRAARQVDDRIAFRTDLQEQGHAAKCDAGKLVQDPVKGYDVLHCPAYRSTYAEFLKVDFPRIPCPKMPAEFQAVFTQGPTLRKLHLMDPATSGLTPYPFMGGGNNVVDRPLFEDGKVWINETQYFDAAPEVSWGFYIGGYQPAQKWLKDRRGRALTFEDVKHYQRILKILAETYRIMQMISMEL